MNYKLELNDQDKNGVKCKQLKENEKTSTAEHEQEKPGQTSSQPLPLPPPRPFPPLSMRYVYIEKYKSKNNIICSTNHNTTIWQEYYMNCSTVHVKKMGKMKRTCMKVHASDTSRISKPCIPSHRPKCCMMGIHYCIKQKMCQRWCIFFLVGPVPYMSLSYYC